MMLQGARFHLLAGLIIRQYRTKSYKTFCEADVEKLKKLTLHSTYLSRCQDVIEYEIIAHVNIKQEMISSNNRCSVCALNFTSFAFHLWKCDDGHDFKRQ